MKLSDWEWGNIVAALVLMIVLVLIAGWVTVSVFGHFADQDQARRDAVCQKLTNANCK